MRAFTSPSGFYAVQHPNDWNDSREENIVNICPPDESSAVTLSAYHGATLELGLQMMTDVFKDYTILSPWQSTAHHNWTGFAAEFVQPDDTEKRVWLAVCAHRSPVLVLATANDTEDAMKIRRATYQAILDSLVINHTEELHE
jgi:hypothetical protein